MSKEIVVNLNKKPIYNVLIEKDFDNLSSSLEALGYKGKKCCIVTDTNVEPLYADAVGNCVKDIFNEVNLFSFDAGEKSKNIDTVMELQEYLVEKSFGRKDVLIALGGGVVGDLCGFAASIYMRGIDFVQIPTTLLADVDSSIGGKTAVDFKGYKNLIGAFYMPKLVYINTNTLSTLPEREFYAGFAEVMKYGLIMDASFYEWLIDKMYEIHDKDEAILEEMIEHCVKCKQRIVEKDPYEQGDRALLNFGHTLGHAIEKHKNFELLHGECVALGCVCAAYISWKKEMISMEEYYEVRDMFVPFNLPISITDIDPKKVIEYVGLDKKNDNKVIKFILLKKVGKAVINTTVTEEEMLNAINEIYFSEEDLKA